MTGRPASILAAGALLAGGLGLALNGGSDPDTAPMGSLARASSFTVTAKLRPAHVLRNERTVLSGTVKPVRASKEVLVQRQDGDGWTTVAERPLNADGKYRYGFASQESGKQVYRVRMRRVRAVAAGTSPEQVLTVSKHALVVFKIPAGTMSGDWNTSDERLVAEVGDTLRIVNDDSVHHRPHTEGAPFPNPDLAIAPGSSADYELVDPFSSDGEDGPLYCAIHGPTSEFWIDVVEP